MYIYLYVCVCNYMCYSGSIGVMFKGDSGSYSQSVDIPDDSKTNTRGDSEIRIGSHSEDPVVIQAQNHVISCECLLLYYCYLPL